jgi:hypothetical protein
MDNILRRLFSISLILILFLYIILIQSSCSFIEPDLETAKNTPTNNTSSNISQSVSFSPLTIDTRWNIYNAYIIQETNGTVHYQVTPQTLMAYGGSPLKQYNWSIPSGSRFPPAGITIDPFTGILKSSGGTLTEGNHSFDISVSDGSRLANAALTIIIKKYIKQSSKVPDPGPPEIIFQQALGIPTILLVEGKANQIYAASLYVAGGEPPYSWSLDPTYQSNIALSGLTIDSSACIVRGTISPTMSGQTIKFKVAVRDNKGNIALTEPKNQVYSISVR